jgi:hypothetical protein
MIDTDSDSDTDVTGSYKQLSHHLIGFAPIQAVSYYYC